MLVRTQILLPKEDLEILREIAAEKGVSVSETVRDFLKDKIKPKRKKMSGAEAMLKMAEWAKKNKVKAPPDLGSNDEYLYGKLAPDYPFKKKR